MKAWLENYHATITGDKPRNQLPGSSGQKPYDGVYAWQLNKIMLQAAIKELPPILKRVLIAKWIKQAPLNETLRALGLSKDQYYTRCGWVIDYIYLCVNNDDMGKSKLLRKVSKQQ